MGSLKEDLPPGKFVIVDQFIDRTFAREKTFFDDEIVIFATEDILEIASPLNPLLVSENKSEDFLILDK